MDTNDTPGISLLRDLSRNGGTSPTTAALDTISVIIDGTVRAARTRGHMPGFDRRGQQLLRILVIVEAGRATQHATASVAHAPRPRSDHIAGRRRR